MKKMLAMILAAMMMCLMVPAMAETATESLIGAWYAVEMSGEGVTVNPADLGMTVTMTVNEDGTLVVAVEGEEGSAGTWTASEGGLTATFGEGSAEVLLQDGKLIMEDTGVTYIFSREASEGFTAPARIAAEFEEAFYGKYSLKYMEMLGQFLPVNALGMESALTIEAGKITIETVSPAMDSEGNLTNEMETDTAEYSTTFEDGLLKFTDETDVKSYIALNEDGTVVMSQEEDPEADFNLTMSMYFSKTE